jgi:hypothetical protein
VKNQAVKVQNVPRPAVERSSTKPRLCRGDAAFGGMPGAFCHGIVKNQQGSAAELLKTGSGGGFALPDFAQLCEKQTKCKPRTSEFRTIP